MGRGSRDYKTHKIMPQRNMTWSCAVSYMLQAPENIVYSELRWGGSTLYKIEDNVFWYRCTSWDETGIFPKDHWGQVGVGGTTGKLFTALAYHEREDAKCDVLPDDLYDVKVTRRIDERDKVIAERFEKIEKTLEKLLKTKKKL